MPRRTDIHTILIIGSGPIVIGQGCEFDYSGVQACRAIREEGYRVVLINSNPATIMTDPEFADATYIEPITPEAVEKILQREADLGHPIDALLPTLGGQTGLNTGMACYDKGILTRYGVQMIGANREAIFKGEDRQVFKDLMIQIGLKVPRSGVVHNMEEARKVMADIGLPLIIRPAFTLGGTGGGIAYNVEEFETIVQRGLDASPVTEVLIEQSVIGWKEYEMEVMRDRNDNVVIICSIENIDAMGVHTGDSITVAPIQTLTDKEYQRMRDASIAVIRAVGVETGGSNIQFAINPDNGDMIVVEMNPRVSRSSALASKATGYPIAKLAAKLAVGYTLDELANDITSIRRVDGTGKKATGVGPGNYERYTSACFEPTIDYCVIKIPRWTFEKFPDANETLTTQMKSVGEAMAIGRTFKEALQKGIRSMEVKRFGFGLDRYDKWLNAQRQNASQGSGTGGSPVKHGQAAHATAKLPPTARADVMAGTPNPQLEDHSDKTTQGESADVEWPIPEEKLYRKLSVPSQGRLYYVRYALKMGWSLQQIHELTNYDPWFLAQMNQLVEFESQLIAAAPLAKEVLPFRLVRDGSSYAQKARELDGLLTRAKQMGYSDVQIANTWGVKQTDVRDVRPDPVYKLVDTCAAEFEAATPYYYSTYETPYKTVGAGSSRPGIANAGTKGGETPPLQEVEDEIRLTNRPKVIIIGGGPNRIGQGIEFDYCCVQAAFAMRELGLESVMINSNPETVSTDYDTSDLLFFEPLTHEDVLNICERLNGGPFVHETVYDLTGTGDQPQSLTAAMPHGINLTNLEFSVDADVMRGIEEVVRKNDLQRAAVIDLAVSPADPVKDVCRSFTVLTKSDDIWLVGFNAQTPPKLIKAERVTDSKRKASLLEDVQPQVRRARSLFESATGLVKGVIVQYGGQTPLNLARGLSEAGVPILGTTVDSIDAAGDREQFRQLVEKLGLKQPANGIARNVAEAREIAKKIGYPVLVRPSFVLGGRAMEIVFDETQLNFYMTNALEAAGTGATATESPILIDKFLDNATECDVDCIADFAAPDVHPGLVSSGNAIVIGVMEHIEEAGIHSGDSACALPPYSLSKEIIAELKRQTKELAKALRVRGLMNVQYAIKNNEIYLIEVNPRASRTVPFVSKATGIPWAKAAAKVMAGKSLAELGYTHDLPDPKHTSVKEVVFPFSKFPGVDVILGPEMRSTGEVMGIDDDFPMAFAKSQIAAGTVLPTSGSVFISVRREDKPHIVPVARKLADMGFTLLATGGTHEELQKNDVPSTRIPKLSEGRPNIQDHIKNGKVQLIINTPTKKGPGTDEGKIRAMAVLHKIPMITTLTAANAAALAMAAMKEHAWGVKPLQAYVQKAK